MIDSQFQRQLGRMEELIHALDETADSPICRKARELVQIVLKMHADALEHVLDSIHDNALTGQQLIDRLAEDPLISNLLVLHGLHPLDLETRVRHALESVKPRLGLHGGDVDLIGVTPDGVVKLRLEGNCHGCPSSRITLKSSIEEAISSPSTRRPSGDGNGWRATSARTSRTLRPLPELNSLDRYVYFALYIVSSSAQGEET